MAQTQAQSLGEFVDDLLLKHLPAADDGKPPPHYNDIRAGFRNAEAEVWKLAYRSKDAEQFAHYAKAAFAIDDMFREWWNPEWWARNALGRETAMVAEAAT